ncbi:MAG: hypothetical protein RR954_09535, partial [Christensenellaceae bacterium]
MDEFHLDMGIRFTPDEQSVQEIDKLFDSFKKVKVFGSDAQLEKMRKTFDDFETKRASLQQAQQMLMSYRGVIGKGSSYNDVTTKSLQEYIKILADGNDDLTKEFNTNVI